MYYCSLFNTFDTKRSIVEKHTTKPRQYRLRNIPSDIWMMIKDVQRSTEQIKGETVTFESAIYELIRQLYKKTLKQ